MANIVIENNQFKDHSCVIHNVFESPADSPDFVKIEAELHEIKVKLDKGSPAYQTIEQLETGAKKRDWKAIAASAAEFVSQFSSATLANLVGSYLSGLLKL